MDKIFSPIKGRVIQFIENQHIEKQEFYKKTDLAASNFKGMGAKSELGGDRIVKILAAYPEISPEWLLQGIGNMIKTYGNKPQHHNVVNESEYTYGKKNNKKIPVIPALAQGGHNGFDVSVHKHEIEHYFDLPILKEKADFAIKVNGDSMHPYYEQGSYIVCKEITINELQWENVYLVLVNHAPMIKRLYPSTNKDFILCRSDNASYRDFEISKADINNIAKILATIKFN
jgi:phage repressor protein C with HTH and peptisase S24 domain